MKNSRNLGILYFDTKKPFQVSIDGKFEDRTEIVCHEVNSKCENEALDIEGILIQMFQSMAGSGEETLDEAAIQKNKEDSDAFFKNDSPTVKEVEDYAVMFEQAIRANKSMKPSVIVKEFKHMIHAGRICTLGDKVMTIPIWGKICMDDKLHIISMYCSFFANPLERL